MSSGTTVTSGPVRRKSQGRKAAVTELFYHTAKLNGRKNSFAIKAAWFTIDKVKIRRLGKCRILIPA
jgi:hypothetical protein